MVGNWPAIPSVFSWQEKCSRRRPLQFNIVFQTPVAGFLRLSWLWSMPILNSCFLWTLLPHCWNCKCVPHDWSSFQGCSKHISWPLMKLWKWSYGRKLTKEINLKILTTVCKIFLSSSHILNHDYFIELLWIVSVSRLSEVSSMC